MTNTFYVTLPDGRVAERSGSVRGYSHAVIGRFRKEEARRRAAAPEVRASHERVYADLQAALSVGVGGFIKADQKVSEELHHAARAVMLSYKTAAGYADAMIAHSLATIGPDDFYPFDVLSWSSSEDLANKAARKRGDEYADVQVIATTTTKPE